MRSDIEKLRASARRLKKAFAVGADVAAALAERDERIAVLEAEVQRLRTGA